MEIAELASHIDHTVLRPDAQQVDVERACQVARELGCAAVCVNSIHVALASRLLNGSSVLVVGVVGFPFGATYTAVKVLETELAIEDGADEIDMVVAIGQLKDEKFDLVESDIAAVVHAAAGRPVKVILECGLLSDAQKQRGADIVAKAGADVLISNHTIFDGSKTKLPAMATRKPGGPHPYVIGTESVLRYLKVAEECAAAAMLRLP